jgi:hypothetical protein
MHSGPRHQPAGAHSPATSASSAVIPVIRHDRFCSWTGVNAIILGPIPIPRHDIVVRNPIGIRHHDRHHSNSTVQRFSNGGRVGGGTQRCHGRQRDNEGSHDLRSFLGKEANQRARFMIVPRMAIASRAENKPLTSLCQIQPSLIALLKSRCDRNRRPPGCSGMILSPRPGCPLPGSGRKRG